MLCRYPLVKVIDYRDRWAELETNPHPFAIIVMAHLRTLETEGNIQERYTWKKRFLMELYQQGMKRKTILAIYKFIDWIMQLPEELETEIYEEIKAIEEAKLMSHITTAERIGIKKGIEQGIELGIEKGIERGIEKGIEQSLPALHQAIATIIEIKFGEAGQLLAQRVSRLRRLEALQNLMQKLKYAQSLPEAEQIFDELEFQNSTT